MATTYTDTLFSTKYKDDYSDSAGYYRILYNSGRTLQARELTQMQTIIQKQIERFGNNIFKEGAVVKPGGLNIDNAYEFVKLDNTSTSTAANVGSIITGVTSGIKAEVLERIVSSGDPVTLFVRYVNTTSSTSPSSMPRFQSGESLGSGRVVQVVNTAANPAVGRGTRALVGESVYFTQGFFVFTEAQETIVSKYSDAPDADVGFKIQQEVRSVDDDASLYDNQGNVANITAPGADRYCIKLVLTTRANVSSSENFIHVATVKDGAIFTAVSAQTNLQYNIPRDMVATRIKENSGDYIVKPFKISFEEDSQNTHLILKVSDGIVVVDGYRAARYAPTDLRIKKPTATAKNVGEFTAIDYGNFVDVLADSAIGGPNIRTLAAQNLNSGKALTGSTIGTARVRAIHENGANLRYHLFDINMNAGQSFRDAKSIGNDSDNYFNPIQSGLNTVVGDPTNNTLLFALPYKRPQTVDPKQVEVQIMRDGTSDGSGNFTVSIPSAYALDNAGDWLFFVDSAGGGLIDNSTLSGLTTGSNTTTVTGLPANRPVKAYVYGSTTSPVVRAKTIVSNVTVTTSVVTDPISGEKYIPLGKPDIRSIAEVRDTNSTGADIAYKFKLDNGQRDNFYGHGRMVLNSGQSAPSGNVFVKFDHFNHGNGNFFSASSYTGVVNYKDIPYHVLKTGLRINLRDVLDFRPVMDTTINTFSEADIAYLPQPSDLITSDNTYYLPRTYKLVIDKDANLNVINGDAGFYPEPPQKSENTLPLYNFRLGGNTLDDSDVSVQKIEHRRYTMQDIGHLEKRINNLEELTSLSMLELGTNNFEVLDSAGLNRTKSGFFVDNFTSHILSATEQNDYRAAIDPTVGLIRPTFTDDNIRMIFDSDNSTSVVRKGDNIYVAHTEVDFMNNPFATKKVKINPFTSSVYEGSLVLSPASDEWHDKNVGSRTVIDGGSKLSTVRAYNWDNWSWNWGGKDIEDLKVGDGTNTISKTSGRTTTNSVNKIVSESVVEEVIGERILQIAILPFIRSRIVRIKARGLRPNSNVFLFMDNKNMKDFVREQAFKRYSKDTKDFGNTLRGKTSHKDGSTALTTDASGKVDISFQVPNNSTFRFRAGTKEIKLMDIDVNREELSGTIARAIYTAQGFLDTVHQDIRSTRVLEVEGKKSTTVRAVSYNNDGGGDGGGTGGGVSWLNPDEHEEKFGTRNNNRQGHNLGAMGLGWPDELSHPPTQSDPGPSSKIICTALHQMGLLPYDIFAADQEYGRKLAVTDPDIVEGYHLWAQIVVDWMNGVEDAPNIMPWVKDDAERIERTSQWAVRWAQAIATPWAVQMAHEMGIREKGSKLGKFLMMVGYPISKMVAKTGKPNPVSMLAIFAVLRLIVSLNMKNKYIDNTVEQK